ERVRTVRRKAGGPQDTAGGGRGDTRRGRLSGVGGAGRRRFLTGAGRSQEGKQQRQCGAVTASNVHRSCRGIDAAWLFMSVVVAGTGVRNTRAPTRRAGSTSSAAPSR